MWIKKSGPAKAKGAEEASWQFDSPATRHATPGTIFRVDKAGKSHIVDDLPKCITHTSKEPTATKKIQTSSRTHARVFKRAQAQDSSGDPISCTLELTEAEVEAIDDDDEEKLRKIIEDLGPNYRPDNRYFMMRAAVSASKSMLRDDAHGLRTALPDKRRIAVLLDEIYSVRSNYAGSSPKLGLSPAHEPVGGTEDVTVPWVTSIIEPAEAARTKTIEVKKTMDLKTSIGIQAGDNMLDEVGISAEMLAGAIIRFKVEAEGGMVRPKDGNAALAKTIDSPDLRFEPDAPAEFAFQLETEQPGQVRLRVFLYLNGRKTLKQDISLRAVEASLVPGGAVPPAHPAEPPGTCTMNGQHLFTLPAPRLALEVGIYDNNFPIEILVDGRRLGWRKVEPAISRADLAHKTIDWRKRLVELSGQYGRGELDDLKTAVPDAIRAFATIGVEIHQALFGRPGQRGIEDLRRIADAIAQINGPANQRPLLIIDAEFLPLPWGIVYDRSLEDTGPVDPAGFWGHRFLVERIARAVFEKVPGRALRALDETSVQIVPCINPHLDEQQKLGVVKNQHNFFKELHSNPKLPSRAVLETREAFGSWLKSDKGEGRLLYFFCHASSAKTVDERFFQAKDSSDIGTFLDLDSDTKLRIDIAWLNKMRIEPLAGQPLVFLNACSTAEGDCEFQSPFLTQFMREYDARCLIGSDWKMPTVFADVFSRRFLERFLKSRCTLAEAFIATSDEFIAAQNPFPLIYAIYGRTDIVVSEEQI